MDHRPSIDLLEANHPFPGTYQFKAIGLVDDGFEDRVLEAVRSVVATPSEIDSSVRTTASGRHVAVTLDVTVQTADQVREIYDRIRGLDGLTLLL